MHVREPNRDPFRADQAAKVRLQDMVGTPGVMGSFAGRQQATYTSASTVMSGIEMGE